MELLAQQNLLTSAIELVGRAINKRSPLPICKHILARTQGRQTTLEATDLDMAIRTTVPSFAFEEGSVAIDGLPAQSLLKALQKSDENLTLKSSPEGGLSIKSSAGSYSVTTLPAEEFPDIDYSHQGQLIQTSALSFKEALQQVLFSVADTTESRAVMAGVLFEIDGYRIKLVSTDGRRMSKAELEVYNQEPMQGRAIVPAGVLEEIVRSIKCEQVITISFSGSFRCTIGDTVFYSRQLEGQFPDYNRVIPSLSAYQSVMRADRKKLLGAVRRILKSTKPASRKDFKEPFHFRIGDFGALKVTCDQKNIGKAEEVLPVVYQGKDLHIAFNGTYLEEVLDALDSEEVEFYFQDDTRSAKVNPYGAGQYAHILMPVRIREAVAQ